MYVDHIISEAGDEITVMCFVEPRQGRELAVIVTGDYERGNSCSCHPHDPNCEHSNHDADFTPSGYWLAFGYDDEMIKCKNVLITDMIEDGTICNYLEKYND